MMLWSTSGYRICRRPSPLWRVTSNRHRVAWTLSKSSLKRTRPRRVWSSARTGTSQRRDDRRGAAREGQEGDAGELDHLGPFFGFVGDELSKVGGRADKWCFSEVSQPRLHLGIGEGRVDLLVELVNNLGRRVLARLIASHELTHGRDAPKEPEEEAPSVEFLYSLRLHLFFLTHS